MNYEPVNIPYKATGERSVSDRRQLQEPVEVPAPDDDWGDYCQYGCCDDLDEDCLYWRTRDVQAVAFSGPVGLAVCLKNRRVVA